MFLRLSLVTCAVLGLACSERHEPSALFADRDDFGAPVAEGTAEHPARIVSLNPPMTELLFAIGVAHRLVGRSQWDTRPDSARFVPDVGPGLRPNVEAVLGVRPDLVVLYASADNRAATERLRAAGIDVVALKVDSIGAFVRATHLLGRATGQRARAAVLADSVARSLDRVRALTARLPRPTVFWHVWNDPLITIGGGSWLDELVEIAGGRNVYGEMSQPSPQVALEDVIRRAPDVVLAGRTGAATIRADHRWRALGAVREGRVLVVDSTLVGWPSVRLGDAALSVARLLHPRELP